MNRRHLIQAGLLVLPAAAARAENEPLAPILTPLAFNKPIKLDVKSHGVEWRGNTYQLVKLHQVEFRLDVRPHLTALVKGAQLTFDDVDYDVHAAVFGEHGVLLGTARGLVSVARLWAGKPALTEVELKLDFGLSEAYPQAKSFCLAITRRKVLTPDDWAKEE
jgi:hypothetical protein